MPRLHHPPRPDTARPGHPALLRAARHGAARPARHDTPVVTPDGRRTTARAWAEELGLFYAPSILFFDEAGHEILRVDSVAHFFRLRNVLNYVANRGYLYEPSYQRWRANYGF